MRLVPNPPAEGFPKLSNIKFYVGALQKSLYDILDMDKFNQLPVEIVHDKMHDTNRITFVRHLESMYNEYKVYIKTDPKYQEFMSTKDIKRKKDLSRELLQEFFVKVGIDYKTGLSQAGHQQGEQLTKLYAEFIQQNPSAFPDLIYVSPYVRTRLTAHYFLKNIQGLDIDFDKLIDQDKLEDLILGSFQGKDIAIKMDERIRERDHGSNIAPSYIRDFWDGERGFHDLLSKEEREMVYYYTSPAGGESQVQTNARAKEFLLRNYEKNKFKNIYVFSHHLTTIGALLSIFGGSFETFYKLNELRRPDNGSLTTLSKIPRTRAGEEDKFRVAGYNLSLQE